MRPLVLALVLVAGCSASLTREQAERFDRDLTLYVELVPARASMDAAEIASHDVLGSALVKVAGKLSGRVK